MLQNNHIFYGDVYFAFSPNMSLAGYMRSGPKVEGLVYDSLKGQGMVIKYDGNHDTVQVADLNLPWTSKEMQ